MPMIPHRQKERKFYIPNKSTFLDETNTHTKNYNFFYFLLLSYFFSLFFLGGGGWRRGGGPRFKHNVQPTSHIAGSQPLPNPPATKAPDVVTPRTTGATSISHGQWNNS